MLILPDHQLYIFVVARHGVRIVAKAKALAVMTVN